MGPFKVELLHLQYVEQPLARKQLLDTVGIIIGCQASYTLIDVHLGSIYSELQTATKVFRDKVDNYAHEHGRFRG
jgi:hypothetical protein